MLLFDGSAVPCARPQNTPGVAGNMLYTGTSPIFITTKLSDILRMEQQACAGQGTGQPMDANASMLLRRLRVYRFSQQVVAPRGRIPFCGHCFATYVFRHANMRCVQTGAGPAV